MIDLIKSFTLKYRTEISALLKDNDEARTMFNMRTIDMEEKIKDFIGNRCFYVMLITSVLVALLYGWVFYIMQSNSESNIIEYIKEFTK